MRMANGSEKISGSGSGRYETRYGYSARNEMQSADTYQCVVEWDEEAQEWVENQYYQGGYSYTYDLRGDLVTKREYNSGYSATNRWDYYWASNDKLTKMEYFEQYSQSPSLVTTIYGWSA